MLHPKILEKNIGKSQQHQNQVVLEIKKPHGKGCVERDEDRSESLRKGDVGLDMVGLFS